MHFSRITPQHLRALQSQPALIGEADAALPGRRDGDESPAQEQALDLGIVWDVLLGLLTLAPGSAARRALTGVARPNFYRHDAIHCYTPARVRYGADALGALAIDNLRQAARRLNGARTTHLATMPRVRRWLAALPVLHHELELPLRQRASAMCDPLLEHTLQHLARLTSFWQTAATAGDAMVGRPRSGAYQLPSGAGSPRRATYPRSDLL